MTDAPDYQDKPPRVGTVKVTAGFDPFDTRITVWTGTEWVKMAGVTAIDWQQGVREFANLTLRVESAAVEFSVPAERVSVALVVENAKDLGRLSEVER